MAEGVSGSLTGGSLGGGSLGGGSGRSPPTGAPGLGVATATGLGVGGTGEKGTDAPPPPPLPPFSHTPQLTELQLVLVVPAATIAEVVRQREVKLAADYEKRRAEAEVKAWREATAAAEEAAAALAHTQDDQTKGSKTTKGSGKSAATGKKGSALAAVGVKGQEKEKGQ